MASKIELGKGTTYPQSYDASLLFPIAREKARTALIGSVAAPFTGSDIWTAYEMSWLNSAGKPQVAIAEFDFSAAGKNIIESKSFKYYLNSLNECRFENQAVVAEILRRDLRKASMGDVGIRFYSLEEGPRMGRLPGICVDPLDIAINRYTPSRALLSTENTIVNTEQLYSHLLKSNCPVTGQPDWATVWIEYSGHKIDQAGLLRYIVSFRRHQGFHESCVETIFVDLLQQCQPEELSVYARYTRRGGLDINPFRTNCNRQLPFIRLARQ